MSRIRKIAAYVQKFNQNTVGNRLISYSFSFLTVIAGMPAKSRREIKRLHHEGQVKSAALFTLWCIDKILNLGKVRRSITIAGWADSDEGVRYLARLCRKTKLNQNDSSVFHAALQCLNFARSSQTGKLDDTITDLEAFFDGNKKFFDDPKNADHKRFYFVYRDMKPGEPEVRDWVKRKVEGALATRLNNFQGRARFFDKDIAYAALSELQGIFEQAGKEFFLVSGTLLGACRGGDFISSDYDLDLGVIEEDVNYQTVLELVRKSKNFKVVEEECTLEKITLEHTSTLEIEFFIHRREGDFFVLTTDVHAWYYSAFKLKKMNFKGGDFNVPDNTERYLEENYGNWKNPAAFFDFSYNTPNRVYRDNTHGLVYLADRLHNAFLKDWRESAEYASQYLYEFYGVDFRSSVPRYAGEMLNPVADRLRVHHDDLAATRSHKKFATSKTFESKLNNSTPSTDYVKAQDAQLRSSVLQDQTSPFGLEARDYAMGKVQHALKHRLENFQGRKKFFSPEAALEALKSLTETFKKRDKRFFLVSGTLLGAMRENDFVSSDYDLDLGIFEGEITLKALRNMFAPSKDFVIDERSTTESKLGLKHKSGLEVEFFLHLTEDEHFVLKTDVHSWYYTPFDLQQIEFRGVTVNIPDQPERYLTENYGNWESKTAFFDFSYDTPNRIYNNNLEGLFYLTDRLCNALRKGWQASAENSAHMLSDFFGIDHTGCIPVQQHADMEPIAKRKRLASTKAKQIAFFEDLTKTSPLTDEIENNFFTPGPVQMAPSVLRAGQIQSPYFRNEAFSALVLDCEEQLLNLTKAPPNSRVLLLSASGTGGLDAAISNFCSSNAPTLALNSHGFGQRLVDILDRYNLPKIEHNQPDLTGFTPDNPIINDQKLHKIGATLANHHDTIFGCINDIGSFHAKAGDEFGECLHIVDAISSFLCDPINMTEQDIDVLILASQKALGLPAGLAILVISPKAIEFLNSDQYEPRSFYFDLRNYLKDAARGQTPFTPPVSIILQLSARLSDLDRIGIDAVVEEKRILAAYFRNAILESQLPFEILAIPASNAVTALKCTDDRLDAGGIVRSIEKEYKLFLTPSGGALSKTTLRVSHMGQQTKKDLDYLVSILKTSSSNLS